MFTVPETFEEFQKLMSGRNVEEQAVIIERMIKCNHPSLGDNNREKLSNLFAFLLQHLNDADGHVSISVCIIVWSVCTLSIKILF